MKSLKSFLIWGIVVLVGLASFTTLALSRGEQVSAIWMVTAAISVYCIAYRFYSLYIANRVMQLDPNRLTPAERHNDGLDYVPTHKGVLFGHHFAAIAGRRPSSWSCIGSANGLSARYFVDYLRRGICRCRTGYDGTVCFYAS